MSRAGGALTAQEYEHYIRSSHWTARKQAFYATHKRKCAACGTGMNLHLHHKRYDHLGAELDADLVILCQHCHSEVHRRHDDVERQIPLDEVTEKFIVLTKKMLKRERERERNRGREKKEALQGAPQPVENGEFVPLRQRMTFEERKNEHHGGRAGRMSGLPIRRI